MNTDKLIEKLTEEWKISLDSDFNRGILKAIAIVKKHCEGEKQGVSAMKLCILADAPCPIGDHRTKDYKCKVTNSKYCHYQDTSTCQQPKPTAEVSVAAEVLPLLMYIVNGFGGEEFKKGKEKFLLDLG